MIKYCITLLALALLMVSGGHFLSLPPPATGYQAGKCTDSADVYVLDKGIHITLLVPVESCGEDWRTFLHPDSISPHARPPFRYLELGMGDRDFYIHTPEWRNLQLEILLPALFRPTQSVMHVTGWRSAPLPSGNVRRLRIDECQYRKMTGFIRGSFATEDGNPVFVARGYHHNDGFFKARQQYHLFYTCNNWAADALHAAGQPTPLWPLFPQAIMRHLH